MNAEFWRGKTVLLTGHTGFKGSWLSLWLQSLGAHVIGYALDPPNGPNLFEVANVANGITSTIGDIRDFATITATIRRHRPTIVIHMAAQALVRYSYEHPVETYATNVMGTVNLLEAVRQVGGVKVIVSVTSDKCYENREWVWSYRETEPLGGYDPYSNSKGCAELVTAAYRNSYFNPADFSRHGVALASARAGNVIGGGDWGEDRLVPDIIRAILDGKPVVIRNPDAVRPWQHVLEPLSGYLMLAERLWEGGPAFAEAWNFGPTDDGAKPVRWIAQHLTEQWGDGASWQTRTATEKSAHEANYLRLDCAKAKARLDWHPQWDLTTALHYINAWYKAFRQQANMRETCLAQIGDYAANRPTRH